MRYYLAARYERKAEMLECARDLVRAGHIVTSDWILGIHEGNSRLDWAMEDLANLRKSDCLIYFSDEIVTRSRFVEWGIAIGLELQLVVIGDNQETPFHMFARVRKYNDWKEFQCVVLESITEILLEQSQLSSTKVLESILSEPKSEPIANTWMYPRRSSMVQVPNDSISPQE